jgi:hypothetical protein
MCDGRLPNDFERAALIGMNTWAKNAETQMKKNARWKDHTTNARNGLYGDADFTGGEIVAVLGHTVTYGKFLELAHGARYAILIPTLIAEGPQIQRYVQAATRGMGL